MLGSGPAPLPDPPLLLDGQRYMEPPAPRLLGTGDDRALEELARLFPHAIMNPRAVDGSTDTTAAPEAGEVPDGAVHGTSTDGTHVGDARSNDERPAATGPVAGDGAPGPPGPAELVTDAARRAAQR